MKVNKEDFELNDICLIRDTLLNNILNSTKIKKIKNRLLKNQSKQYISGLNTTTKSLFLAILVKNISKPVLVITPNINNALKLQLELSWMTDIPVKLFTGNISSPYETVFCPTNTIQDQYDCLEILIKSLPSIVIISAKDLLNKFLSPEEFEKYSIKIAKSIKLDMDELNFNLQDIGYNRVSQIVDPGEYSIRGDICDIYPMSSEPVRIELAYDQVESLRIINIETQRSTQVTKNITIRPKYKIVINDINKNKLINKLKNINLDANDTTSYEKHTNLKDIIDIAITQIHDYKYFEGIECFASLVHDKLSSIIEYLPPDSIIILDEFDEITDKLNKSDKLHTEEYNKAVSSGKLPILPNLLHADHVDVINDIGLRTNVYLKTLPYNAIDNDNHLEIEYNYIPGFLNNFKKASEYIKKLDNEDYNILITTDYPQRVKSLLLEFGIEAYYETLEPNSTSKTRNIIITKLGPTTGFVIPEYKIASITDSELFNKQPKKISLSKKVSKRENLDYILSPSDLHEHDYVVHERHGIGKFIKLQKISLDNQQREYVTIEYANGDKLYVPVDQINLISRYRGVGDTPPKISKMGGSDWESVKRKSRKAVEDIAAELLNLYAQRAKIEGFAFDADSGWQSEMEDSFEYVETPDQLRSIQEVKVDMESLKPMDRLICGDVGYGKTEVAIRSIFKAILSNKQVAILVPTTILAQQHYNTITQRFLPYPINIGLLSRFKTTKEQKEIINKLVLGECDIAVGTHRLIQKDVSFKDLGLVVIDEEHRFGVKHKEKLKQLRTHVDVLSMSATPIPRTLYLALSGIRDMSIINTPPVNRSPIKTTVGEYNKNIVKTAILSEINRGGQVYYVHNRVQSIYKVAQELSELVPDARLIIGHGQMNVTELENVMLDFSNHKYDILVCTTIIESGLDIPNVNTIIIDNADSMGLAQLYQLRGRVGRSDRQAYSYCFYKPKKILSPEAKKRLMAIKEFNTLGSGYQIALRDLEIRGIGNILGSQQHGNMVSVGFDLYCEMLDDAVKKLKGEPVVKKSLPVVDINITAFIPDVWVGDRDQKIIEYKRLASVYSMKELEIISDEWHDRFGKIPLEVSNLIKVVKIRLLAKDINFNSIREEKEFVRIFTNYDQITWHNIIQKIPPDIAKRTKWVKMPQTSIEGSSSILVKYMGVTPQMLLNYLEKLCIAVNKYLMENKGD